MFNLSFTSNLTISPALKLNLKNLSLEIKELLTKAEFVNGDGTVETWESPWKGKEAELEELLDRDFENIKNQLLGETINENKTTVN